MFLNAFRGEKRTTISDQSNFQWTRIVKCRGLSSNDIDGKISISLKTSIDDHRSVSIKSPRNSYQWSSRENNRWMITLHFFYIVVSFLSRSLLMKLFHKSSHQIEEPSIVPKYWDFIDEDDFFLFLPMFSSKDTLQNQRDSWKRPIEKYLEQRVHPKECLFRHKSNEKEKKIS